MPDTKGTDTGDLRDCDIELGFTATDLELIQALVLDPSSEPMYCSFRAYLQWPDELPNGISPEGYDTLCDLWTARACRYHGLKLHSSLNQDTFAQVWDRAIAQGIKWPGFSRLELNERDREYYERMCQKKDSFD